ncbi:hypothetical protein Tco_1241454 [Tanacetum coccineum]
MSRSLFSNRSTHKRLREGRLNINVSAMMLGSINSFASCMVMLVTTGSTSIWFCLVVHRILSGWLCLLESASVWCLNPAALSVCLNLSVY